VPTDDRLDSWKEIAAYLKRGVRTAQRWERVAALPVRRVASERGAVFAFRSELDTWWRTQPAELADPQSDAQRLSVAVLPLAAVSYHSSPSAPQGPTRVRTFLSQAIAIDPDFALAHANLAVYFFTLAAMGLLRPEEGMPAVRASARRALDLDPSIAEAHALLATVAGLYDHDWLEAARRFDMALVRGPVSPAVRFHYAIWFLSPLQRHTDALEQLEHGLADDPLYLLGRVHVAMELYSLGRSEEGLAELNRILEMDPHFGPALGLLGREYAMRRRVDEAMSFAERTYTAIPRHPNAAGFLAGMLRRTGNAGRSREVLESFERDHAWSAARARAEAHLVCGELDPAVEWIKTAVAERDPGVWLLFAGTAGKMIRSTQQWPALRAQLNLPQPA
jgi:Tfp pilus assembly protein PilF